MGRTVSSVEVGGTVGGATACECTLVQMDLQCYRLLISELEIIPFPTAIVLMVCPSRPPGVLGTEVHEWPLSRVPPTDKG